MTQYNNFFFKSVAPLGVRRNSLSIQIILNLQVKAQLQTTILVIPSTRIILINAIFCVTTQPVAVIPYRRFGTTYRSHLQYSRIQEQGSRFEKDS